MLGGTGFTWLSGVKIQNKKGRKCQDIYRGIASGLHFDFGGWGGRGRAGNFVY